LFLGVTDVGKIIAYATTKDRAAAIEFRTLKSLPLEGVFFRLVLGAAKFGADARNRLLKELRRIHLKEWIPSKRLLADGSEVPCTARNCGGLTLEAEFGIRPNSSADPDFMGWELKQHAVTNLANPASGGAITLMTPEPTGGFYKDRGFTKFVRKFGYADKTGKADRINVGGIHVVGKLQHLTGFTMTLVGYNASTGKITDPSGHIALVHTSGEEAATWAFTHLMAHWNKKHPFAAYVPSIHNESENKYHYGQIVRLGEGTDFLHFLRGMSAGKVYYDPGIKLEDSSTAHPRSKRRSQFRIRSGDLPLLYDKMESNRVD
jgi:MvaI/BcnI restriction endonuclease family